MRKELLIAEPNVTAQEEFEKIFEGMDAQLIFAENGEDALLKIKLYKPDLVIADVTMPNKDGFELCKLVKTNPELQQIPFVLMAGIFEEIQKSEQKKVGADGVVAKPLNGEEIVPLIEDLLRTGPVSLEVEEAAESGAAETGEEETLLSMEGLPPAEKGEEGELSLSEEALEPGSQGEGEEAVIELTDIMDEEPALEGHPDKSEVEESLEGVMEGEEASLPGEEALDEISLDGFDLDESDSELELEEAEPEEKKAPIEEAREETVEGLPSLVSGEDRLEQAETEEPSGELVEAELEEEIDRRIDLVLEEEQGDEEDTLLELEEEEDVTAAPSDEIEALESLAEEVTQTVTPEPGPTADESSVDEGETLLELAEDEEPEKAPEEEEPVEEISLEELEEIEEKAEQQEEGPSETLDVVSDDLEDLSMEDLESLGETVEELEELPVEEELEGILGEEVEKHEESGEETGGEPMEGHAGVEEVEAVSVDETSQPAQVLEEVPDATEAVEQEDERDLADIEDIEPEGITEAFDTETAEDAKEEPLEDIGEELSEEGIEDDEGVPEESLEEPDEDSEASVSYPELIKEEEVSEEELDAFQKRLSADFDDLESPTDEAAGASDERIESLVRQGVEQVLNDLSESVIPELTKTLVQVASKRIEKVVQQVVPELAESAIRKELERLRPKEG
jgi:CheY-like chemotaxis protein